jgi:hypothetical protein
MASLGCYGLAVPHVGLSGASDPAVWRYAYENDLTVTFLSPALVVMTETAVSVAVRVRRAVLFPQQLQGGVLVALQLAMDVGEIGRDLGTRLSGAGNTGKQPPPQLHFRHLRRQRPDQPRCPKPLDILVDRALTDAGATGDLPLPQLQLEVQPKDFSRLAHGHSLSGHRGLPLEVTLPLVLVSNAATPISTFDSC